MTNAVANKTDDTVAASYRVNRGIKKRADQLFRSMGLNTSTAINMFLSQSVQEQALPFQPRMIRAENGLANGFDNDSSYVSEINSMIADASNEKFMTINEARKQIQWNK